MIVRLKRKVVDPQHLDAIARSSVQVFEKYLLSQRISTDRRESALWHSADGTQLVASGKPRNIALRSEVSQDCLEMCMNPRGKTACTVDFFVVVASDALEHVEAAETVIQTLYGKVHSVSRKLDDRQIDQFLQYAEQQSNLIEVVAYSEFPFWGYQQNPELRKVEREYWLKISDKRFWNKSHDDDFIVMHVHYIDAWSDIAENRTHSKIAQINVRHTRRPPLDPKEKDLKNLCIDLQKWKEKKGRAVLGIPQDGWSWESEPNVLPGLRNILMKAEVCRRAVRSLSVDLSPQRDGEGRLALIIAISQFESSPKLERFSESSVQLDALKLKETLKGFGWRVSIVMDKSITDVMEVLETFSQHLENDTEASVFAFLGFGLQCKGKQFLVLKESSLGNREYASNSDFEEDVAGQWLDFEKGILAKLAHCRKDPCRQPLLFLLNIHEIDRKLIFGVQSSRSISDRISIDIRNSLMFKSPCCLKHADNKDCGPIMQTLCTHISKYAEGRDIITILSDVRNELEQKFSIQLPHVKHCLEVNFYFCSLHSDASSGCKNEDTQEQALLLDTDDDEPLEICFAPHEFLEDNVSG